MDPDVQMDPVNPTPEQAWDNQMDMISNAMKVVVDSNGGTASKSVMVNNIEGECHFDNSNGFTMEEFVDTICTRPDVLLKTGLSFGNGVFSTSGKDYVTANMLSVSLRAHFDKVVSWYRNNRKSDWVLRAEYCHSEGPSREKSNAGRMTEMRRKCTHSHTVADSTIRIYFGDFNGICIKVV